ncbi:large ribosomal subunit protein eL6 isoform X1 [Hydra vulgaris]|uniref:large ribosomal subunit protein eL6 isoform X1 n=1 Tax=Hydra vulgaris TaxID=6087 RepID=UPI000192455C|nr:60S ribosomal protein L6 [Hydra vulgaris]XP_047141797.1 60S ribosomal protein L6 [Hydra vulgaris]
MAKPHSSRNSLLPGGISRLSRSAVFRKRALYKKKRVPVKAKKAEPALPKVKKIGGEKNGGQRTLPLVKQPRFYPVDDVKRPLKHRKHPKPPKLRSSLTPGTVVILLAGRHKGKRVVFLKQLPTSGLLLVTGPFTINGVPLRRVPQSYVLATKTKIDISKVKLSKQLTDDFFKRQKKKVARSKESMFDESAEGYKPSEERKSSQKEVDEALLPLIKPVPLLTKYMKSLFTLRKGQYPHQMIF